MQAKALQYGSGMFDIAQIRKHCGIPQLMRACAAGGLRRGRRADTAGSGADSAGTDTAGMGAERGDALLSANKSAVRDLAVRNLKGHQDRQGRAGRLAP